MGKSTIYIIMAVAALLLPSCGKSPEAEDPEQRSGSVVGRWHMVSWSSLTSDEADVYISFGEDGRFDLYQRVYTPYYVHYDGTYSQQGDIVTGTYSDGTSWNTSYVASFNAEMTRMTLTGSTDGADIAVYDSISGIPEDVTSGELGPKASRSVSVDFRFL